MVAAAPVGMNIVMEILYDGVIPLLYWLCVKLCICSIWPSNPLNSILHAWRYGETLCPSNSLNSIEYTIGVMEIQCDWVTPLTPFNMRGVMEILYDRATALTPFTLLGVMEIRQAFHQYRLRTSAMVTEMRNYWLRLQYNVHIVLMVSMIPCLACLYVGFINIMTELLLLWLFKIESHAHLNTIFF